MTAMESFIRSLSDDERNTINSLCTHRQYAPGEKIFAEGDIADYVYYIESGTVSIRIQKFTQEEEICTLGPGEYFGEMAIFSRDKRNASAVAVEDTVVLTLDKSEFLELTTSHPAIGKKIEEILSARNEALMLRENLIDTTGVKGKRLHVSIKGDPSLRESAFTRERYESAVDKFLMPLVPAMIDLLTNRSVFQMFVGLNNGEVRVSSIFDPFVEEVHPVNKLVDEAYRDRHFPQVVYDDKATMIKSLYQTIQGSPLFETIAPLQQKLFSTHYTQWEPLGVEEIVNTVNNLPTLRDIPNFYLRTFTVSMTQDAIRMQFNCDGTHIVSSEDFVQFLEDNVDAG